MKAADTNVLVRVITGDDETQLPEAEAWLSTGAWVPSIVLVELSWVLESAYAFPKNDVAAAIEAVLELPGVVVEDEAAVRAALGAWGSGSRGRGIDFADCMILQTAARAGHGPLGTFDTDLARLPGTTKLGRRRG